MAWKTLDQMDLNGKRVLVRVDINVPVENGRVTDATRILRILPTINDILDRGGKPMLIAHFGRPKGKVNLDLSLSQIVPALEDALGRKVVLIETLQAAETPTQEMLDADVTLLENIRFHPGETANDPDFARRLAALGDIYCNDAFSAAHRAHASTETLARMLPACAGRLMQAELKALETALANPTRPVGAVVGGAKVSTKIELLENLVNRLDVLVIGGGMANTFLAALGADLGNSLKEEDFFETARDILAQAAVAGCRVLLPSDGLVAGEFAQGAPHVVAQLGPETKLGADQMVLDAGPDSIAHIRTAFEGLKTLIWNGPLGAFEITPFDTATMAAARVAAEKTRDGALISVAGGGDTVAALNLAGVAEDFTYISTAGGAFLEWMEGKTLPGVAALNG
jgi:phosphoglycerate kinase